MCSDLFFYSFSLYILGLVLMFAAYDIFLRLGYEPNRRSIGLIFSGIFLFLMGMVFFILGVLILIRLYNIQRLIFYLAVVVFLVIGLVTFKVMKWKRQVIHENKDNR